MENKSRKKAAAFPTNKKKKKKKKMRGGCEISTDIKKHTDMHIYIQNR